MTTNLFPDARDVVRGIDFNNVHRAEVDAAQVIATHFDLLVGPAHAAFLHFYHLDLSNAAIHLAPGRFSPITFRLAEALEEMVDDTGEIEEVLSHRGQYAEDPGR